jgi:putative spermidine/putrescine transport system substrate-binding protein
MGSTLISAWMVDIARINGGSEENMDPAFAYLKKLLPNVAAVAASPGALATLFQQGQIDVAPFYNNNAGDMQAKGVPIAMARPDTGWLVIRSTMHIVKNTKNTDLAAAYINAALSPDVQQKMGDKPYLLAPTNSKVPYSQGLQQYAKDAAQLETYHGVDWAKLNPRRGEYIDRFNRDVKV